MLMADKLADPCTSLFQFACGGWLRSSVANVTREGNRDLDNVSVMDEKKENIDKKIKGDSLGGNIFIIFCCFRLDPGLGHLLLEPDGEGEAVLHKLHPN